VLVSLEMLHFNKAVLDLRTSNIKYTEFSLMWSIIPSSESCQPCCQMLEPSSCLKF
jgi:hypothetical protein